MPETDDLSQRLELLAEYVRDLEAVRPASLKEYQADKMLRRYVERMLHMAVEACLTLGLRVLVDEGLRSPENYRDIFAVLGDRGILSPSLVASMTYLVEFRNLLVYQHDMLEDTVVYGVLKRRLSDFTAFAQALDAYRRGLPPPAPEPLEEGPA